MPSPLPSSTVSLGESRGCSSAPISKSSLTFASKIACATIGQGYLRLLAGISGHESLVPRGASGPSCGPSKPIQEWAWNEPDQSKARVHRAWTRAQVGRRIPRRHNGKEGTRHWPFGFARTCPCIAHISAISGCGAEPVP